MGTDLWPQAACCAAPGAAALAAGEDSAGCEELLQSLGRRSPGITIGTDLMGYMAGFNGNYQEIMKENMYIMGFYTQYLPQKRCRKVFPGCFSFLIVVDVNNIPRVLTCLSFCGCYNV